MESLLENLTLLGDEDDEMVIGEDIGEAGVFRLMCGGPFLDGTND